MSGKISSFLREYVLYFSLILTILGLILFLLSLGYYMFNSLGIDFVKNLKEWNFYIIIIGFIILITGIYYLYSFLKNKRFVIKELKTNKRSEFVKRHAELKNTVKHMPSKYHKMIKDKEKELKIR
jgi:heme/copper-type cytochrome/quinol oxidase subunit 1